MLTRFVLLAACALVAFPAHTVRAQFGNLTNYLPNDANAIALVNVEQLQQTALAKQEGWHEKLEQAFQSGMVTVPPDAKKCVFAARLDFETKQPLWQLTVLDLVDPPEISKVAARFQGTVDKVEGRDVAVLPGDTYAIAFGPRFAAVGYPADRQKVVRWIKAFDSDRLSLSPYLEESKGFAENGAPIIISLDLEGAIPPSEIRHRLDDSQFFEGKRVDLDAIVAELASIRGLSLGITIGPPGPPRYGVLKVDFGKPIKETANYARALTLMALANNGMMLDDLRDWEVSIQDKSFRLSGALSASGMRRILSVFDTPVSLRSADSLSGSAANQDDPKYKQAQVVAASQQYFRSVVSLIDDLKQSKQDRKTMGQLTVWFERYAQKIDRLPILNVDPALQDYGYFVSSAFRQGAGKVQGAAARSRVRQQDVPQQYDVYGYSEPIGVTRWGAYGWNGWQAYPNERATAHMRTQVRTQERLQGVTSANQVLQEVDNETAKIRQEMTNKYSASF